MDEVLHKPAGRRPRQSDGRELSAQEQLGLLARRVVTDWKHFYQWARFHGRRVIPVSYTRLDVYKRQP